MYYGCYITKQGRIHVQSYYTNSRKRMQSLIARTAAARGERVGAVAICETGDELRREMNRLHDDYIYWLSM